MLISVLLVNLGILNFIIYGGKKNNEKKSKT